VACNNIKSLLLIDFIACMPVALLKYNSTYHEGYSDFLYFLTFNYAYVPRMYTMFLTIKLLRIRRFQVVLFNFLRKVLGWRLFTTNLFSTFQNLILIMHLMACFWSSAA